MTISRHNLGRDHSPGFTLIELVMVLVIMGTLAAVAVPRYAEASHRYQARLAAQTLAGEIDRVVALARASRTGHEIHFNATTGQYTITRTTGEVIDPALSLGGSRDAAIHSATFKNGLPTLRIDGYGRPEAGGIVVVRGGRWYSAVSIAHETGRATASGQVSLTP